MGCPVGIEVLSRHKTPGASSEIHKNAKSSGVRGQAGVFNMVSGQGDLHSIQGI